MDVMTQSAHMLGQQFQAAAAIPNLDASSMFAILGCTYLGLQVGVALNGLHIFARMMMDEFYESGAKTLILGAALGIIAGFGFGVALTHETASDKTRPSDHAALIHQEPAKHAYVIS